MLKNLKIRICKSNESQICIDIIKKSWSRWWSKNEELAIKHIKKCIEEKRCLVVLINNDIVASLIWGILWNKIHIQDISVKKEYRRNGIAKMLMNKLGNIAKKEGFKEFISDCDTINKKSILLHLNCGFKKSGYIKKHWGSYDSYIFSKRV